MAGNELLQGLIEATLAGSAAVLLVLALRRPVRAASGAQVAYALWLLPPLAMLATLLPAATVVVERLPVAQALMLPAGAAMAAAPVQQHIDLALLQSLEAVGRLQRTKLHVRLVAENGGRERRAEFHFQAAPATVGVHLREARRILAHSAVDVAARLHGIERRQRRSAGHGGPQCKAATGYSRGAQPTLQRLCDQHQLPSFSRLSSQPAGAAWRAELRQMSDAESRER